MNRTSTKKLIAELTDEELKHINSEADRYLNNEKITLKQIAIDNNIAEHTMQKIMNIKLQMPRNRSKK